MEALSNLSRTLGNEMKSSKSMWDQLMQRTASFEDLNRSSSPLKTKMRKIYEFKESSRTVDPGNNYDRPKVRASLAQTMPKKGTYIHHHREQESHSRLSTPAKALPTDEAREHTPQKRHYFRPVSHSMHVSHTSSPSRGGITSHT